MPDTQISEEMVERAHNAAVNRLRNAAPGRAAIACILEAALSGHTVVSREPTRGMLISMALRMDHAFCAPAQEIAGIAFGYTDDYREVVLADLAKAYEEITGAGFYAPEREDLYRAMIQAAPPVPEMEPRP